MPKVNFYLLKQEDEAARRMFACRLAEKLLRQGLAVQLYVSSKDEAEDIDQLMWNLSPESFVPHGLVNDLVHTATAPAIAISWGSEYSSAENLLNLSEIEPPSANKFSSIAEFVLNQDDAKNLSRERWQAYKKQGFDLNHHQM